MANRATAGPSTARLTDCLSTGVLARTFPLETVQAVLDDIGLTSQRERKMPAHIVLHYVASLALFGSASYR